MSDDTRERLASLEVEVRYLTKMVETNSGILKDLHEAHLQAKGGWAAGKAIAGAVKMLGSGGAGAGVLAALQHWFAVPKAL